MTFFSTILNSNNAGGKSIVEDWLRNHRFFLGTDKDNVNIYINDDLSLTIESSWEDRVFYPDISINELPPYGIRELVRFDNVSFVGVKTDNPNILPNKYKYCENVHFEYCTIPKIYKQTHSRISFKECRLV